MAIATKPQAVRPRAAAKPTPREEVENLMADYAQLYKQRADILAAAKEAAEPLTADLDVLESKLQAWAEKHQADEFGGKRMLTLQAGAIGFRAGLKMMKWDADRTEEGYEAAAVKAVRKLAPSALVEKVDGREIAKVWDLLPKLRAALEPLGAFVEQKDTFICTPKK